MIRQQIYRSQGYIMVDGWMESTLVHDGNKPMMGQGFINVRWMQGIDRSYATTVPSEVLFGNGWGAVIGEIFGHNHRSRS